MIDNNSSGRGSGKLFGDAPVASAEDFIADEQMDADPAETQQECIPGADEVSGAAEEPCGKISTSARQNRPEDQFPADELFLSTGALIREENVPGEPAAVPLGFVYSESGELQRCTPAGFERCLDCLRNSTNLLSLGNCTYLMKIELMKKMLEQRFDFSEGGDEPPLQRELFSASRGIFGVSTVLYGIEELFRCISRYFGLERNRIEETLVQCHGGMTVMPDGTTVSFSRYEERLFSEIFDAIAQLGIERELLVPFFESIAGENYLPSQIREQICTLLYENSSADGKISLDDLIENFFALYRDHYNRMITSAEQRRYPLYDVYLNIRLYYYHARQIIMKGERTGGIDVSGLSEKMKQLLALKLKNCLEVQIRNRPLLVEMSGYFFRLYLQGENRDDSRIIRLVCYLKDVIAAVNRQYNEDAAAGRLRGGGFSNVPDTVKKISDREQLAVLDVIHENVIRKLYIYVQHNQSNNVLFFSFDDSSVYAVLKIRREERRLTAIPLLRTGLQLQNVSEQMSVECDPALPLNSLVDSVVRIMLFETVNGKKFD